MPVALRFIALGMALFALGYLGAAVTGSEVWNKSAARPMTTWELLSLSAQLMLSGAGLWWLGGRLRQGRPDRIGMPSRKRDPM